MIQNHQDTMLQSKNKIEQRWLQYCSSLYKDPGGQHQMVQELEDITLSGNNETADILYSEMLAAIHTLKRNKCPLSDSITANMLQAGANP